ncbi:MAG: hypothetical protein QXG00_04115 [Candidatus Woesearchaeota archaeon]
MLINSNILQNTKSNEKIEHCRNENLKLSKKLQVVKKLLKKFVNLNNNNKQ